jgi:hypothetical protein
MTIESKIQLSITKPECEPRAWQVNATVDGVDAGEITYYHGTKQDAKEQALQRIKQDGRLPHDRYIPA